MTAPALFKSTVFTCTTSVISRGQIAQDIAGYLACYVSDGSPAGEFDPAKLTDAFCTKYAERLGRIHDQILTFDLTDEQAETAEQELQWSALVEFGAIKDSGKQTAVSQVIIHVCDWNSEDRYFEASETFLPIFREKVQELVINVGRSGGISKFWDWFVEKLHEGNDEPWVKGVQECVDMTLDVYFFDYNNPIESVKEWEL